MKRVAIAASFLGVVLACTKQPEQAQPAALPTAPTVAAVSSPAVTIDKSTACKEGELTYLGFRGAGTPPRALYDAVKARFPDVMVYEVKDGTLGVFTAEPHSMNVRQRHEDAAATVPGWKGDVVDFARVEKDCSASFHTPMPPP